MSEVSAEELPPLKYPNRRAIDSLTDLLNLSRNWGQDWEIEIADDSRLAEFCDVYESAPLDREQRFALMALVVASYDEFLMEFEPDPEFAQRLERLLTEDFALHKHTLEYWCQWEVTEEEEDPDNPEWVFHVTAFLRRIWTRCTGNTQEITP